VRLTAVSIPLEHRQGEDAGRILGLDEGHAHRQFERWRSRLSLIANEPESD
jgi:hypothetical protein